MSNIENPNRLLMQASFRYSGIGSSVQDEGLTSEVQRNHDMAEDSVKVVKSLFKKQVAPINKSVSKARRFFNQNTFEGIGGTRLLVVSERERICNQMDRFIREAKRLVEEFIYDYDIHLETERRDKGDRYDITDYPSKDKLTEIFTFDFLTMPMADPSEFLKMALGEHVREQERVRYEAMLQSAVTSVTASTTSQLLGLIKSVAEQLGNPDAPLVDGENRKGALPKLQEFLERVPQLNLTNSPDLMRLYRDAKDQLSVTTDAVRASQATRRLLAVRADNIAKSFCNMGGRQIAV